jgi:hypothetical protein
LQAPVVIEYGLDQASSMDLFDGVTAVATGDILKRD